MISPSTVVSPRFPNCGFPKIKQKKKTLEMEAHLQAFFDTLQPAMRDQINALPEPAMRLSMVAMLHSTTTDATRLAREAAALLHQQEAAAAAAAAEELRVRRIRIDTPEIELPSFNQPYTGLVESQIIARTLDIVLRAPDEGATLNHLIRKAALQPSAVLKRANSADSLAEELSAVFSAEQNIHAWIVAGSPAMDGPPHMASALRFTAHNLRAEVLKYVLRSEIDCFRNAKIPGTRSMPLHEVKTAITGAGKGECLSTFDVAAAKRKRPLD